MSIQGSYEQGTISLTMSSGTVNKKSTLFLDGTSGNRKYE